METKIYNGFSFLNQSWDIEFLRGRGHRGHLWIVRCVLAAGAKAECRQPILQTRSCLVPLHLLKAFCTQRLWRHSLDEFREWTIKAFTMCFKGRISFSKLSHVSIHFLFLLIFGLFFFSHPLYNYIVSALPFHALTLFPYTLHCAFLLFSVIQVSCSHQIVFFQLIFFAFLILCLLFSSSFLQQISHLAFEIYWTKYTLCSLCLLKSANNYFPQIKW